MKELELEVLTASQKGVNKRLSAAFETLVVRTVHKIVSSPGLESTLSEAVIDILGLIIPVMALVKLEKLKLAAQQAKIDDRWRKFVEAGTKMDLN